MPGRQRARTATTDILLTRARLTVITGLTGSQADCLLAPAHGMAGDMVGDAAAGAMAGAFMAAEGSSADADS